MNDAPGEHDPHTLAGAYALNAVDEGDRLRFEEHLSRCAECAEEVRGLAETAARMGRVLAAEPPEGLRARVMAEIGQVRQVPPLVPADTGITGIVGRKAGERRRRAAEGPPGTRPETRPGTRPATWWPRAVAGLAAACLVAAVALGVVNVRTRDLLERQEAVNRQIATVLAAPDAHSIRVSGGPQGAGTLVVVSRSQDRLVVVPSGLAGLPEDRTYQMWRMGPARTTSAGTMRPGEGASAVVVDDIAQTAQVGVTIEPAGGSAQPTSTPLLVLNLPPA
ncbi:anti-sigma factor domain-containing protein [Streptosporangium sp. NPDC050855]|uniref:anti-sigma factor n=1 Tax=Streptosporangium sp. NPDC050855 TaxID=3366194 RepID=UPI0037914269